MNYHNITHDDMNNGDGLRVVLWLSGCSHHCYNCQNPQTWNPNSGIPFDNEAKQELFTELSKDYISGITLSGGDPLYEDNLDDVLSLLKEIKENFPTKTIWLYTGYTFEYIVSGIGYDDQGSFFFTEEDRKMWKIISMCDVLVDGEYIDAERNVTLKWRGSSNQKVIDIQRTLKTGNITLHCD